MNTFGNSVLQLETLLSENKALSQTCTSVTQELTALEASSIRLCEHLEAFAPALCTQSHTSVQDSVPAQTAAQDAMPQDAALILDALHENFRLRAKLGYCQTVIAEIESQVLEISDLLARP